jgi:hypothetical protein
VWWICGRLFVVSLIAVYLISGLFGNPAVPPFPAHVVSMTSGKSGGRGGAGGAGGVDSAVDAEKLGVALRFADPGPASF